MTCTLLSHLFIKNKFSHLFKDLGKIPFKIVCSVVFLKDNETHNTKPLEHPTVYGPLKSDAVRNTAGLER